MLRGSSSFLFLLFLYQLKAVSMDVDDFQGRVSFEVFTQFGDEDIHAAGGEVVVGAPDLGEGDGAWQHFVEVLGKEAEEV